MFSVPLKICILLLLELSGSADQMKFGSVVGVTCALPELLCVLLSVEGRVEVRHVLFQLF